MPLAPLLGLAVFLAASFGVGSALIRRALRTRQIPEFAAGSMLLLSGGVGYTLILVARLLPDEPAISIVCYAGGLLSIGLGCACLALCMWLVFRPGWVGASIFALLAGATGASFVGVAIESHFILPGSAGPWGWLGSFGRLGTLGWVAVEAVLMARRLRAIPEPDAAVRGTLRRLRYWCYAALAAGGILGVHMLRQLARPVDPADPVTAFSTAVLGLASAWFLWLAFDEEIPFVELAQSHGAPPDLPATPPR